MSGETFSGGEEFAYDLKALKRATLVGEKTGGGANIGAPYRLTSHFEAFIPVGRPVNPITGTNWEGCGVIPDVSVSAEQAFKVAYNYALKSILASMDEEPSGSLQLFLDEAQTALKEMNIVE